MSLDERSRGFIAAARAYASGPTPGFPGHKLILLVAELADELDRITGIHEMRFKSSENSTILFMDDVTQTVRIFSVNAFSEANDGIDLDGEWVASIPYKDLGMDPNYHPGRLPALTLDGIAPDKPIRLPRFSGSTQFYKSGGVPYDFASLSSSKLEPRFVHTEDGLWLDKPDPLAQEGVSEEQIRLSHAGAIVKKVVDRLVPSAKVVVDTSKRTIEVAVLAPSKWCTFSLEQIEDGGEGAVDEKIRFFLERSWGGDND